MVYECKHCNGICEIEIIRETEKATEPEIEFCPSVGCQIHIQKKQKSLFQSEEWERIMRKIRC